jgi:hypothetical protein
MRQFQAGVPCEVGNHFKGAIFGKQTRAADWDELERQWLALPEDERQGALIIFPRCPACGFKEDALQ